MLGPVETRPFPAKSAFYTPKNKCLELVAGLGNHPPSSRAHAARGSPDSPWPYGEQRARGELGKRCFPEQRRFGGVVGSPSIV